jgi:arsenite/tail-anchored protein-transporting ATPase
LRVVLFTGKGGVGKTTAAAGTAVRAAVDGHRTLVLSTDAAHSLADAFGAPVGSRPTPLSDRLFVQQIDAQQHLERSWTEIAGYLRAVLEGGGIDPVTAGELTVLPGAEEVLALLELLGQVRSGDWDVVVVDCAPTAETLRLLALPEALGWYLDRVAPAERRLVKALRPVLTKATGVPMPRDGVFEAVERLHRDLEAVRQVLTSEDASVRLVLTPETMVVAEARRSLTTLSLFGYRVDGVLANRVFPTGGADDWRRSWAQAQSRVLEEVEQSFTGLPVWRSTYRTAEPVGVDALRDFARAAYGRDDPLARPRGTSPMTFTRTRSGTTLRIALPFVAESDIDLARHGDELVVTVGSYRRLVALPGTLGRQPITGARIDSGALKVRFRAEQEGVR